MPADPLEPLAERAYFSQVSMEHIVEMNELGRRISTLHNMWLKMKMSGYRKVRKPPSWPRSWANFSLL